MAKVKYKCKRCGHEYSHMNSYKAHLTRKTMCKAHLEDIVPTVDNVVKVVQEDVSQDSVSDACFGEEDTSYITNKMLENIIKNTYTDDYSNQCEKLDNIIRLIYFNPLKPSNMTVYTDPWNEDLTKIKTDQGWELKETMQVARQILLAVETMLRNKIAKISMNKFDKKRNQLWHDITTNILEYNEDLLDMVIQTMVNLSDIVIH